MPTLTQHAPGTFAWPELGTTDQAAASKFYGSLFGWTIREIPMAEGSYTIFMLGDRDAAACYTLNPKMQAGVPPYWGNYITVADAAQAAKRAQELGGTVISDAFDVMGIGKMAILQDPTGAMFCVWQPITHIGAGVLDEPGALCWTELTTTDTAKAGTFYSSLVGWKSSEMPMPEIGAYTVFQRPDGANAAGMMTTPKEMTGMPPVWTSYFQVGDIHASTAKATSLGGQVLVPPTPVPNVGSFSMIQDPQGAVFALMQMSM